MALKLYNTLTRAKEVFEPLDAANVRLYVCGPTVYDFAHIGNARPVIVFDVLYRLLRHLYGPEHVTYVRNITDVDDKINARAGQDYPDLPLNEAIRRVTEKTEAQFHADMRALGALDPNVEPRATEHIAQMKTMIEQLIDRGCAYVAEDHVLFDVASMPDYGKLSGRSLDEMIAGARVEVAPYKRDPMDFVLWKPSKPGEPSWASPAGIAVPGRPGWHIECSAMADRWLWEEARPKLSATGLSRPHMFDIHGGGIDLVFPHHENEIAQSRCAYATPIMAQVWMHNGFLQVEGEKMAKSLGNFVTIRELTQTDLFGGRPWPGGTLRFNMLKTHYRQPVDWSASRLSDAGLELNDFAVAVSDSNVLRGEIARYRQGRVATPSSELVEALADDLNTPEAVAVLHAHKKKAYRDDDAKRRLISDCEFLGIWRPNQIGVFSVGVSAVGGIETGDLYEIGLSVRAALVNENEDKLINLRTELLRTGRDFEVDFQGFIMFKPLGEALDKEGIDRLIAARAAARAAKNFKEADRLRAELEAMGITLKDAKDPRTGELVTTWEVAR